jgi:conjugal transfer pilus assembly protein TraD
MKSITILDLKFNSPWRKTYELNAAIAWTMSGCVLTITSVGAPAGESVVYALSLGSYLLAVWWGLRAYLHGKNKIRLFGERPKVSNTKALQKIMKPGTIYLGRSFEWTSDSAQKLYDVRKVSIQKLLPGRLGAMFLSLIYMKRIPAKGAIGQYWIHGLCSENDKPLYLTDAQWEGNTCVMGVPGSGKTTLMSALVQQNCLRGDATLIIDPKADKGLENAARAAAKLTGRDFYMVHLTRMSESVRINPISNFLKVSELATRLASLVPAKSESDPFKGFAWGVINSIAGGIIYMNEWSTEENKLHLNKPTIAKIRRYVELGSDGLVRNVLLTHFRLHINALPKDKRDGVVKKEITDLIALYRTLGRADQHEVVDQLIAMYEHPDVHFEKMIASLKPPLISLSGGELSEILSPDPEENPDDERLIVDSEQIVNEGAVLYVALDALADEFVSGAVGAILLADWASMASARYRRMTPEEAKKKLVHILVDEAGEIVKGGGAGATGMYQLLSKGRGAGFRCVCFSQAVGDWSTGLGSKEAAFKLLGNTNNKIALRCTDPDTQEFFSSLLGEVPINTANYKIANGSSGNDGDITNYNGGYSEGLTETETELFTSSMLGGLPNFEYIGILAGQHVVKGRFEIFEPTM